MKNDSFFSRIPLPVMIIVWLGLVALGAVLVYSVFFSKPADSTAQSPAPKTPIAQATKAVKPAATQAAQPANQQTPAAAEPTKAPTLSPMQDTSFNYGLQADYLTGDIPNTVKQAKRLRMDWIKQQLRWGVFSQAPDQFDWTGFDQVVEAANQQGLKVMLSIVTAPEWSRPSAASLGIEGPPDDLNAYAKFVGEVVDRYKGKVHAIEVWNEQNIDAEWKTNPQVVSPEKYVEMLKLAYETIKAKDPNIVVISGALSPTGYFQGGCSEAGCDDGPYLKRMVDAGALDYADCVGVHANGYNVPPDKTNTEGYSDETATFRGPFTNPIPSWYFRSTLELYRDTVKNQKPLCITEFGWGSSEGFGYTPPSYEFVNDNTLQEQGDYIVQAFDLMKQWGYVKLAFLFNLDYAQKSPDGVKDRTAPWSIFDTTGAGRPAFEQLRLHMKQLYPDK
jgi:polysaccharide biosynthesis protein PslG